MPTTALFGIGGRMRSVGNRASTMRRNAYYKGEGAKEPPGAMGEGTAGRHGNGFFWLLHAGRLG